jgi:hypothetical protein
MRLVLDPDQLPPGARWERRGDVGRLILPDAPEVSIEVSDIAPLPDDPSAAARRTVAIVSAGSVVRLGAATEAVTVEGWPFSIVDSEARAADTGALVDSRIHLFYRFLVHGARVTITSPVALAPRRAFLVGLFERARPDFGGEIVALAQIVNIPLRPKRDA